MRHAVIGDVGGQREALEAELEALGADLSHGQLPEDLTIVQLGDLVHRGPDSDGVLALVGRFLEASGDRWIQLAGNHEAQYLRHPAFHWRDWVSSESADMLPGWWADGRMRAAAAVPTPDGGGTGHPRRAHTGLLASRPGSAGQCRAGRRPAQCHGPGRFRVALSSGEPCSRASQTTGQA